MNIDRETWFRLLAELKDWKACIGPAAAAAREEADGLLNPSGTIKIVYQRGFISIAIGSEDYFGRVYTNIQWLGFSVTDECHREWILDGYKSIQDFHTASQVAVILNILGILPEHCNGD